MTPASQATAPLSALERHLIAATQQGLPLVAKPYEALGALLGITETEVLQLMQDMQDRGLIRRIGAVPNHYRLGYLANGMTVWDVDDDLVDAVGERIGGLACVSHCYRRPRHLPDWPYNLFAMLHGRSREEVQAQAQAIRALLGDACRASDILYSSAILKKTGLRLAARPSIVED
ncbi:MAG TPA: Lrp/AsnC family transcriptional regulator [Burkholderiaceae bacterium]|nr:Lrp/AsnC family transcriptional regulator [Burkholderiaceae bacterium]